MQKEYDHKRRNHTTSGRNLSKINSKRIVLFKAEPFQSLRDSEKNKIAACPSADTVSGEADARYHSEAIKFSFSVPLSSQFFLFFCLIHFRLKKDVETKGGMRRRETSSSELRLNIYRIAGT